MFDKEFYPTPDEVLDLMKIDCSGKVVLEPSGGKGDIVDYVKDRGCKDVIAYELNEDLSKILQTKCRVIGGDFFKATSEDVSHVDLIVMNPPFSNANKHIEHAYNIAPEGCEIISLCNNATIEVSRGRSVLHSLIKDYGITENLGNCFDNAERKTGIDIGLIRLFKPLVSSDSSFDGFFLEDDDEQTSGEGITSYNEVYATVQRHVGALKIFDKMDSMRSELNYTLSDLNIDKVSFLLNYNDKITTREEFSKYIQKKSWRNIFSKMKIDKYMTSKAMEDVNKFVEQQQKYPFTMKNIYRMFDIIMGTRRQMMNRSLEIAVDSFTKHSHENRFGVEGWKTNSGHMLNHKFIVERVVNFDWGKIKLCYGQQIDKLNDLSKVLCLITGKNYDDIGSLNSLFNNIGEVKSGQWYEWGFFSLKCFKKGTMHIKFTNKADWYSLNKAYGEMKGFTLSDKYKK